MLSLNFVFHTALWALVILTYCVKVENEDRVRGGCFSPQRGHLLVFLAIFFFSLHYVLGIKFSMKTCLKVCFTHVKKYDLFPLDII